MSSSASAGAAAMALPLSTADRLALFMQKHALSDTNVALQLTWTPERVREYIETRRQRVAPLDRADVAVEHLMERHHITRARQTVAASSQKPLAPVRNATRRTSAPTQFVRHTSDVSTILSTEPLNATLPPNRKRKRRVASMQLGSNVIANARPRVVVTKAASDAMCPIRIDIDVNGTRFQDTLLLNVAASPTLSPEAIADQLARDERLGDDVKDAIAESIRRQLTTFPSVGIDTAAAVSESLHPIYLDLIIDGLALRDQFEWDISRDFGDAQAFATVLVADLKLPVPFESAIVFSLWEQVTAFRRVIDAQRWIANDPTTKTSKHPTTRPATASSGYIDVLPPVAEDDDVERDPEAAKLWQPALSELSKEERQFLATRLAAARRATSVKRPLVPPARHARVPNVPNGQTHKRAAPKKDAARMPRPLNAFIMYCQVQKDSFARLKPRRSASETRKIMGDMWRRMTDEDKEEYAQLAELENEKRRREHIFEQRDRAIAEWEEEDARRRGLIGASTLDTTTEYTRGVLLANYMNERHEVDQNREAAFADDDDEGDDIDMDDEL